MSDELRAKAGLDRHSDHPLFVCILCPDGQEWVGDYDPADLIGECPSCHYSVGIFPATSFRHTSSAVAAVKRAVMAGAVHTLDGPETP